MLSTRTHVQNEGWQKEVSDGAMAGTKGKSLRLEGIKIRVNGGRTARRNRIFPLMYRILAGSHMYRMERWQETKGKSLRLEGIKIRLTGELAEKYHVEYRTHVQNEGWQDWVRDDAVSGTHGKGLRLEGIEIRLVKKIK